MARHLYLKAVYKHTHTHKLFDFTSVDSELVCVKGSLRIYTCGIANDAGPETTLWEALQ